jgi:hypothetical protein
MINESGEGGNALRQATEFARSSVFVQHAFGDAARQFGLGRSKGSGRSAFVASIESSLHLLYKGTNAADARAIDFCATIIATDALASLWRIGHVCPQIIQKDTAGQQRPGTDEAPPLERLCRFVNRQIP